MDYFNKLKDQDYIRLYQSNRVKVLDVIIGQSPRVAKVLENYLAFQVLTVLIVCLIIGSYFHQRKKLTVFSFHIICMSIGSFILLANGIMAFRNSFLVDNLSPIMQHSKRVKVRTIHQTVNVAGAFFIFLGWLFILADKFEEGESLLPDSIHGIFGYLVLILIVAQSSSGMDKLEVFRQYNTKIKRWHSELGLFTWDVICVTVILGCLLLFGLFSFVFLILTTLVVAVWASLHVQMKKKAPEVEDDGSLGSSTPNSSSSIANDERIDLLSNGQDIANDDFSSDENSKIGGGERNYS